MLVCSAPAQTAEKNGPVNEFCPVMTEEKVDPAFTTTYKGQVIGFCCERCLAKFEANPERYASRLAALLASPPQTSAQENGESQPDSTGADRNHEHEASQHAGGESESHDAHEHAAPSQEESAAGEHDHEHAHGHADGFLSRAVAWLGKFHPSVVHFPIAMLAGAALAELLLMATGRPQFAVAGRFCLWVGSLGAVGAAVLGWFFGGFHLVDDAWILTTHRWLGTSTAAWSVLVLVLGERVARLERAGRAPYRAVLFIGATLVAVTGFFGGALIYGMNHYTW